MDEIEYLLNEYYSIQHIPEFNAKSKELVERIKKLIYKLEQFKAPDTGYKKSALFVYNNMFIWDNKNKKVSTRKISSPFSSNFIKLRELYNEYNKELKAINNIKNISNKININRPIVHAEVLVNILFLNDWSIKLMKNKNDQIFSRTKKVYFDSDIKELLLNQHKLMKNKELNTKKISSITVKIIQEYSKIIGKTNKLFI
jgi:hypothetical protein